MTPRSGVSPTGAVRQRVEFNQRGNRTPESPAKSRQNVASTFRWCLGGAGWCATRRLGACPRAEFPLELQRIQPCNPLLGQRPLTLRGSLCPDPHPQCGVLGITIRIQRQMTMLLLIRHYSSSTHSSTSSSSYSTMARTPSSSSSCVTNFTRHIGHSSRLSKFRKIQLEWNL